MSFVSDFMDAGGLNVVGGLVSDVFNVNSQEKINAQNQAWQLAAENRQRAYDAPVAQMARLKQAGLNPNLIYGSSGNTGVLNARASTATAPQISNPLDKLRDGLDIKNAQATLDATRAQIGKTEADTLNTNADTSNKIASGKNIPLQGDLTVAQTRKQIQDLTGWSDDEISLKFPWLGGYSHKTHTPIKQPVSSPRAVVPDRAPGYFNWTIQSPSQVSN